MFVETDYIILYYCLLIAAADAPDAEVDEVLGSLKLRIRHMFKWARSEVREEGREGKQENEREEERWEEEGGKINDIHVMYR